MCCNLRHFNLTESPFTCKGSSVVVTFSWVIHHCSPWLPTEWPPSHMCKSLWTRWLNTTRNYFCIAAASVGRNRGSNGFTARGGSNLINNEKNEIYLLYDWCSFGILSGTSFVIVYLISCENFPSLYTSCNIFFHWQSMCNVFSHWLRPFSPVLKTDECASLMPLAPIVRLMHIIKNTVRCRYSAVNFSRILTKVTTP